MEIVSPQKESPPIFEPFDAEWLREALESVALKANWRLPAKRELVALARELNLLEPKIRMKKSSTSLHMDFKKIVSAFN